MGCRRGSALSQSVEVGTATTTAAAFAEAFSYDGQGQRIQHNAGTGTSAGAAAAALGTLAQWTYLADGSLALTTRTGVANTNSSARTEARSYRIEGWLARIGDVTSTAPAWTVPSQAMPAGYAEPYAVAITYSAAGMVTALDQRSPYAVISSPVDAVSAAPRFTYGFDYDGLGRLTAAEFGAGATPSSSTPSYAERGIAYDASGNLLALTRWSPTGPTPSSWGQMDVLGYAYAPGRNRLAYVDDAAQSQSVWAARRDDADASVFTYSASGETVRELRRWAGSSGVVAVEERWLSYDEQSLPLSVSVTGYASEDDYEALDPQSHVVSFYRYSGSGQRIYASGAGAGVRRTVRGAGGEALGEFSGSGALVSWSLSGGLGRITASGQRFFYVSDHLGSVRAVVEGTTGSVVEARDYYAYGLEMSGRVWVSGVKAREGYTGHVLDAETGWNYAGARYYAAALARWMVVDPLEAEFPSHSPYNYVLGDPLALVDPDGRAPDDIILRGRNGSRITIATNAVNVSADVSSLGIDFGGQYRLSGRAVVQAGLDLVGVVDPTGAADVANAVMYGQNGAWGDALISGAGALVPYLGDAAKAGRLAGAVETIGNEIYGSYRAVADAGFQQSHHVIQNAVVRNLPGYSRGAAPAVHLTGRATEIGSRHHAATAVQRRAGGGTYGAERRIGYRALREAGVSMQDARGIIARTDTYFESIGVTRSTPTRMPGRNFRRTQ